MPLGPGEDVIRDNILAAPDVVVNTTTEATAGAKTRPTSYEHSSATVEVGKIYCVDIKYINGPNDPAWGAASGSDENVRDVP
jgi:hypothetical protein